MTQETKPAVSSPEAVSPSDEDLALAPPPDDANPPILDAHKTFVITLIGAAIFIGAVVVFVL